MQALSEEQRHKWDRLWPVSDRRSGVVHPLIYKHPVTGLQTMCFHTGRHPLHVYTVSCLAWCICAHAALAPDIASFRDYFVYRDDKHLHVGQRHAPAADGDAPGDRADSGRDRQVHVSPHQLPVLYTCPSDLVRLGRQLKTAKTFTHDYYRTVRGPLGQSMQYEHVWQPGDFIIRCKSHTHQEHMAILRLSRFCMRFDRSCQAPTSTCLSAVTTWQLRMRRTPPLSFQYHKWGFVSCTGAPSLGCTSQPRNTLAKRPPDRSGAAQA
jgi:hypothetical protein